MKPSTIVIFALAAGLSVFSAIAQDIEEEVQNLDIEDEDVPAEGRTLGFAPAFGLGLLGGSVGTSLIRGIGSFIGLRSPQPVYRPAFYPAPYVMPAGIPFPGFPGRSSVPGKGVPNREIQSYVPIPYAPALPVNYFRSEDGENGEDEEELYDNTTY